MIRPRMLKISRSPKGKTNFWQELQMQYHARHFCDLQIKFQDTGEVVLCHKMVLASVSDLVKRALIVAGGEPGDMTNILVAEADYDSVKGIVDFLYCFLAAGEVPAGYVINKIALDTLAIDLTKLGEKSPNLKPMKMDPLSMPSGQGVKRKRQDENVKQALASQFWESDDLRVTADLFQPRVLLEKLPKYRRRVKPRKKPLKRKHVLPRPSVIKTEKELENLRNPQLCKDILEKIMSCQGQLDIDLQKEPLEYLKQLFEFSPFKVEHFAILGIKRSLDKFEGMTLTCKLKDGEDPFLQYKQTGEAFKSVLGLSTRDAFCHTLIIRKLNEVQKNIRGKIKPKYVKELAHFSEEQLRNILNDPEIVEITKRQPSKSLDLCHGSIQVTLNKGLNAVELEHLLMVFVLETGEIKARLCKILNGDVDKTVPQLHKFIFHVWSDPSAKVLSESLLYSRERCKNKSIGIAERWSPVPYMIIDSPQLKALYYKLLDPCLKSDVAREYLEGKLNREQVLNKSVVCPKCGLAFDLSAMKGEARFSVHQRRHYFEDYECECEINFGSYEEKKWHVMLHHDTGRKYKKCDFCPYVNNLSKVKMHVQRHHNEDDKEGIACPECGVVCNGTTALKQHIKTDHPSQNDRLSGGILCDLCGKEFAGKKNLRLHHKFIHKEVTCGVCSEPFVGTRKLDNHVAICHPDSTTLPVCSYCGKKYLDVASMRRHMKLVHNEGNAKRHRCDMCPRSFVFKSGLKTHQIQMHLKTLAYKCRVCEEGFYDLSARFKHEKKLHDFQHKQHRKKDVLNK